MQPSFDQFYRLYLRQCQLCLIQSHWLRLRMGRRKQKPLPRLPSSFTKFQDSDHLLPMSSFRHTSAITTRTRGVSSKPQLLLRPQLHPLLHHQQPVPPQQQLHLPQLQPLLTPKRCVKPFCITLMINSLAMIPILSIRRSPSKNTSLAIDQT
jgi:hypothetical protein